MQIRRTLALLSLFCISAQAQQLIGYVSTKDATVTGATDTIQDHAVLTGSAVVTAKDHAAPIRLSRGGTVRVCQTSVVHVTEGRSASSAAPLMLSLDRGAIEIEMPATAGDVVLTADLRINLQSSAPLDLNLRVARNGDTCVDNRGPQAPTLLLSDPFGGGASYELLPGQHVLFEHGSLREVVDHERTPCGCPDSPGLSIADALIASHPNAPAEDHPFPAALSEGLSPDAPPEAAVPNSTPTETHTQVDTSLAYSAPIATPPPAPAPVEPAPAPPPPFQHRGFFHAIGGFFHRVFTGS
jgi:hypothetical protein